MQIMTRRTRLSSVIVDANLINLSRIFQAAMNLDQVPIPRENSTLHQAAMKKLTKAYGTTIQCKKVNLRNQLKKKKKIQNPIKRLRLKLRKYLSKLCKKVYFLTFISMIEKQ